MTNPQDDDDYGISFSSASLELKFVASSAATGEFTGHAAMFHSVDSHRDVIRPGAFAASLASHKAAGTTPALLWAHDQTKPVGRLLSLAEDAHGLKVQGKLNLGTTRGSDAYRHVKEGDSTGLSIGYQVPAGGAVHGRDGTRTLQRVAVHEVSLVTLPSNSDARIREVKSLASAADLERLLREGGLSRRAAEKIAGPGFAALSGNSEQKTVNLNRVAELLREQTLAVKSWS